MDSYGQNYGCVTKNLPFYVTIIVPFVIILISNIITLVCIVIKVTDNKYKCKKKDQIPSNWLRIKIVIGLMILFGLTWTFGLFVGFDEEPGTSSVTLQYFFTIFNTLQGLHLFLFFLVRDKKVKNYWIQLLKCISPTQIERKFKFRYQCSNSREKKHQRMSYKNTTITTVDHYQRPVLGITTGEHYHRYGR